MSVRAAGSPLDLAPLLAFESARPADVSVEAQVLALFDAHRDRLLRYVCAFGLPVADAEDVVQDVFLALYRHLAGDGARLNLQGWLFRVAHNQALKRRAARRREEMRRHDARAASFVADPARDPETRLARGEWQRRVAAVLQALPDRDRCCVHLRGDGLRYREIAQVLGISLGAVAKSLARSAARLKRAVEG